MKGQAFVVSAPSGTGKSTLCEILLQRVPHLIRSVSYTTRPPRRNEVHGRDYFFLSDDEFHSKIERGELVEWARVYSYLYGTAWDFLRHHLDRGMDVVLNIDVQGALSLKKSPLEPLGIFLLPPSLEELQNRLLRRRSESKESIDLRMKTALREISYWKHYDYVVVNDRIEAAVREVESIILACRRRIPRVNEEIVRIMKQWEGAFGAQGVGCESGRGDPEAHLCP